MKKERKRNPVNWNPNFLLFLNKFCFNVTTEVAYAFISFLLVGETTGGGLETLGGDKTHCFITRNK